MQSGGDRDCENLNEAQSGGDIDRTQDLMLRYYVKLPIVPKLLGYGKFNYLTNNSNNLQA